ncbi:MAG: hypothetical protein EAZ91_20400 [Cytophagales bacterium]|nr:MAG: hypothetical protein EAZ91_20400 [Cytophagales bacterium]
MDKLRLGVCRLLVCLLICLVDVSILLGQSLPPGFNSSKSGDGYDQPTGLAFNGQQQFVWDKAGRVWVSIWNGSQYVKQATPVLDISPEVGNWRDFGLLSIALDPNFAQNGFVYLYYAVDRHHLLHFGTAQYNPTTDTYFNASICRLTRYRLVQTNGVFTADPASRKILIGETKSTGIPVVYESHAGGTIVFGRDGSLLLSTGDNAGMASPDKGSAPETYYQQALLDSIIRPAENVGSFRSQMPSSLCGKILRVDPNTGDGLASNPFFQGNTPRSARSRVWALGFRNPFRMTLQGGTGSTNPADGNPGTLIVGDVGPGVWEDLHIIRAGGENAGWPQYEGILPSYNFPDFAQTVENQDEPNPNAGPPNYAGPNSPCNRPFLTFAELLRDAPASGTAVVSGPCGTTPLPGLQRRYVHSPPALDWNHGANITRTPTFSGTIATATTISQSGTAGVGNPFRGNCVIGGAWYPSNASFPTDWHNTLFFADYGANWIRAATLDANGGISRVREFLPENGGDGIVDVAYNPLDGGLYFLNGNTGEVRKISHGGNRPPVVVATASTPTGTSPLSVTFTGSDSSDPDGDPLTYEWTFSDGSTSPVANPVRSFTVGHDAQGVLIRSYTARLAITDSKGLRTISQPILISLDNPAPTAWITDPINNAKYPLDRATSYTLTASVTDDAPTRLTYAWQVTLRHNNHQHREPVMYTTNPVVTISPVGCDGEDYYYLISLKVTDDGGLTAQDSVKIYPNCNSPNLAISGLTATTLSNSSVRLNWINPSISFDNVLIAAKADSGFIDKPSELVYPANASFTGNGADFFGGKVLFQGMATSLVVTNLTPGQRYFFRVYTRRGTAWTGGVEASAIPPASTTTAPPTSTTTAPPTSTTTAPPTSVLSIDPAKCYRIQSRSSGLTLNLSAALWDDGATLQQATNADQLWQKWRFAPVDGSYYSIAVVHNGKGIQVENGSVADNIPLQQWTYWGGNHQQWTVERNTDGFHVITNRNSGKAMTVRNASTAGGAVITQQTPGTGQHQQWIILETTCTTGPPTATTTTPPPSTTTAPPTSTTTAPPTSTTTAPPTSTTTAPPTSTTTAPPASVMSIDPAKCYRIQSRSSGLTLNLSAALWDDGATLQQATNTDQLWQKWRFAPADGSYYSITLLQNGKGIQVDNGSVADNALLQQWTYWGGQHQQWTVRRNAENFYTITNRNSGKAMTVRNASMSEGAVITQETLGMGQHQQWSLVETSCSAQPRIATEPPTGNGSPTVFSLRPNPAQDHVFVDLSAVAGQPIGLTLTDMLGRSLRQTQLEAAPTLPYRFDIGALPSGLYLLRIEPKSQKASTLRVLIGH